MKTNKKTEKKFHAVDFMRQVRSELTEQFLHDKQKYLDYLRKAMDDFKLRQENHLNFKNN
jgi:hypothetical protein